MIGAVVLFVGVGLLAAAGWFVHPAVSLAVVGVFCVLAGLLFDFGDEK